MSKVIDIKTLIQETLEKRVFDIVDDLGEFGDEEYLNCWVDEDGLLKFIKENNPQLIGILKSLEKTQSEKKNYELIHVYKRGLMEGAKVLEALGYLNLNLADEEDD